MGAAQAPHAGLGRPPGGTLPSMPTPMRLRDVATIALGLRDADFWLQRGVGLELGRPTKTFAPQHIGIKVTRTDILLPQYLYYVFEHMWTTGAWSERAPSVSIVRLMVLQPTGGSSRAN